MPSPPNSAPGGQPPRPSSAGRGLGSGSGCLRQPKTAASRSAWRGSGADAFGRHQHPRTPQGRRRGPKRGSGAERNLREALGRSRGGYGTKACVIADAGGRAVAFRLAPGQAHGESDALTPTPCRSLAACRVCRDGWWAIDDRRRRSSPATPSVNTSGLLAPGRRSGRSGTVGARAPTLSPAQLGSTPTAIGSSGFGRGSRSGGPSPPAMRKLPAPSCACSASPLPSTGSRANRP